MNTPVWFCPVTRAGLLLGAALLQGCTPGGRANIIQSIELNTLPPALGQPTTFILRGAGLCRATIDWGENTGKDYAAFDLSSGSTTVTHTFTGWGGGKTVSVTADTTERCIGSDTIRFTINPAITTIAFGQPGTQTCNAVPNRPALARGWLIHFTAKPVGTSRGINFGCPLGGCMS